MAMTHRLSLAHLTAPELAPPEMVRVAADHGFDHVGLRLLPAADDGPYPLLTDAALARETRAAMRDTGVTLADVEIVRIGPGFDPRRVEGLLARGRELGARHVLVAGDDTDRARLIDGFGRLCDLARSHELTADLEFMPWTAVPDIAAAAEVLRAVAHPAAGLLIDALHYHRAGGTPEAVAALPRDWLHYAQLCDAPAALDPAPEALIALARGDRMMPGTGGIDLAALIAALPADIVFSVEVPQLARQGVVPAEDRVQEAFEAACRLLG